MSDGEPFPRPSTRFNALVEGLVTKLLPLKSITVEALEPYRREAARTLLAMGALERPVREVTETTPWILKEGRAPSDAWGGEVLQGDPPVVALYEDCLLARAPRLLFGITAQLMVDHMYGHLYEYYAGSDDWGEEVACRWQYRLLRHRGGLRNSLTAEIVAWTHRAHKQVPLTNYE